MSRFFKNMLMATRLWAVIAVIVLILMLIGFYAANSLKAISDSTDNLYKHPYTVSNEVRRIQYHISLMDSHLKAALLTQKKQKMTTSIDLMEISEKRVLKSFFIIYERFLGDLEEVRKAESSFKSWAFSRDDIAALVLSGQQKKAIYLMEISESKVDKSIESSVQGLLDYANNKAATFLNNAHIKLTKTTQLFWSLLLFVSFSIIVMGYFLIRNITPAITKINTALNKLEKGEIDFEWGKSQRGAELEAIENSLYSLKKSTLYMSEHAYKIAHGDYQSVIQTRSDKDVLGHAMANMSTHLQTVDYINKGVSGLNDAIRGDQTLAELSHQILQFICQYTDSALGCFYVVQNDTIHCTSTYAFPFGEEVQTNFKFGEGLVGEAALQKKPMLYTDIEGKYLKIESATGVTKLKYVHVIPILWNDDVEVLIELGRLRTLSNNHLAFLEAVSITIAATINTSLIRGGELLVWEADSEHYKRIVS